MKTIAVLASLALTAASAQAVVLYNNGAVWDVAGSPNLSVLATPSTTLGFGAQTSAGNAVADNFSVGSTWNVTKLTFYMYQTGSTAFTFTGMNYQIASSHGDAISWTSASVANGGLSAYRVTSTTTTNRDRAIYAIDVAVNLVVNPGSYVLRWQASGSLASGPWQPPIVPTNGGGNAMQSLAGAAFGAAIDAGSGFQVELPFTISGTEVPAPGALGMIGLGALVAVRRRR